LSEIACLQQSSPRTLAFTMMWDRSMRFFWITRSFFAFGVSFALLQSCSTVAFGQGSSTPSRIANLRMVVFDPSGAAIPNAGVTFKGERNVSANTAKDGSVQVRLPYGSYEVAISSRGFKTTQITALEVDADEPPVLNVTLQLSPDIGGVCAPCYVPAIETIPSDLPNVIEAVQVPDAALPTITAIGRFDSGLQPRPAKVQIHIQNGVTQYVCSLESEAELKANRLTVGTNVEIREQGEYLKVRELGHGKWVKLRLVSKGELHNL
jgi:hypothetical protein